MKTSQDCHTKAQRQALKQADRLLKRAGYFPRRVKDHDHQPVEAAACGAHGLRPTWHGKA